MTANKEITVAAWAEPSRPLIIEKRAGMRFLPPAVIGVLGTVFLHTFALETAFLGSRAHRIRPPDAQEPDSANNSAAGLTENLVFIDLPRIASSDSGFDEALASLRAAMKAKPIPVSPPDPSPPAEVEVLALSDDKPSESSGTGDGTDRARLFGIYTGQIQARVERIWRRPRTPVIEAGEDDPTTADTGESFQCQAQIVQDAAGNVQEILLPRCNGSQAWQHSLVVAIQQASPLPAPPSATVFSHSVTLNFIGLSYVPGSLEDEYEIAPMKTALPITSAATRPPQRNFELPPGPPRSSAPGAWEFEQTSN